MSLWLQIEMRYMSILFTCRNAIKKNQKHNLTISKEKFINLNEKNEMIRLKATVIQK